jgi:cobalamin biosynthesis Mg chelatase CobN
MSLSLIPIAALIWPAALSATSSTAPPTTTVAVTPSLTFDLASSIIDGAAPGQEHRGLLAQFCWPPTGGEANTETTGNLEVTRDGTLTGNCTMTKDDAGGTVERKSTLTGTWDSSGYVSFTLNGAARTTVPVSAGGGKTTTGTTTSTVTAYAVKVAVVGGRATGQAHFTFTCKSTSPAVSCGPAEATGTITFTLVLGTGNTPGGTPQNSSVAPNGTTAHSGSATTNASTSNEGAANWLRVGIVVILALLILLLIVWAFARKD